MSKTVTTAQIEKTSKQLRAFVSQASRKLLEFEVMLAEKEIAEKGPSLKRYRSAKALMRNL